jgi:hypothetical protein
MLEVGNKAMKLMKTPCGKAEVRGRGNKGHL